MFPVLTIQTCSGLAGSLCANLISKITTALSSAKYSLLPRAACCWLSTRQRFSNFQQHLVSTINSNWIPRRFDKVRYPFLFVSSGFEVEFVGKLAASSDFPRFVNFHQIHSNSTNVDDLLQRSTFLLICSQVEHNYLGTFHWLSRQSILARPAHLPTRSQRHRSRQSRLRTAFPS